MVDLSVQLGRLHLRNPILVASGTFGYALYNIATRYLAAYETATEMIACA